jgi:hypothetical protein
VMPPTPHATSSMERSDAATRRSAAKSSTARYKKPSCGQPIGVGTGVCNCWNVTGACMRTLSPPHHTRSCRRVTG